MESQVKLKRLVWSDVLTPEEFLRLKSTKPEVIRSSRFIPPEIGDIDDYGSVFVEYDLPQSREVVDVVRENWLSPPQKRNERGFEISR